MTIALAGVEPYQKLFDGLNDLDKTKERKAAMARFEKRGFPTLRDEAWRYTNLTELQSKTVAQPSEVKAEISKLADWAAHKIVFLNGRFSAEHSSFGGLPTGVSLNVGQASTLELDMINGESPFFDLNAALADEGFKLNVDAGVEVDGLIAVFYIGNGDQSAYNTRSHIVMGQGAKATLVEQYVGQGAYFANTACLVDVHEKADLTHLRIQADSDTAFNIANTHVNVQAHAKYVNFALNTGAKLQRNEIRGAVSGEGADLHLLGANLVANAGDGKGQHFDTTTFIDHAHADTTSNEVYKSVLRDKATCVFQGKILVQQDSQRIVGNQMSRALMLSNKAQINTKPELEIYADDVICSHGATVGDLDEEALFYLRSRGIPQKAAQSMLVSAFIEEVLDDVENEAVRESLKSLTAQWLYG